MSAVAGRLHDELTVMSLGQVLGELASVEDALRAHRSTRTIEGPANRTNELMGLTARQRLILHELRRRAHRRVRLRPGGPDTAAAPDGMMLEKFGSRRSVQPQA